MLKIKLIIFVLLCSCANNPSAEQEDKNIVEKPFNLESHLGEYQLLKARIKVERNTIDSMNVSLNQKLTLGKALFSNVLIDSIIPYWEGTKWDYNGHTTKPRSGEIACGYFVTTTLKDAGIKLDRIHLSQQASSVLISTLCEKSSIHRYGSINKMLVGLNSATDRDVHIVGLDYHTGLLYKRNGETYFVHSNYIQRAGVMVEKAKESKALNASKTFMIGNLTANEDIIQEWLRS